MWFVLSNFIGINGAFVQHRSLIPKSKTLTKNIDDAIGNPIVNLDLSSPENWQIVIIEATQRPRRKIPRKLKSGRGDTSPLFWASLLFLTILSRHEAIAKQKRPIGICKTKAHLQPIHWVKAPPNGAPTGTAIVMTIDMYERKTVAFLRGTMSVFWSSVQLIALIRTVSFPG